jgi:hypothetical protein
MYVRTADILFLWRIFVSARREDARKEEEGGFE